MTTETYKGTIKKVFNRNGRWSLLMDDDNWYGNNREAISNVNDGDACTFQYEKKGNYLNIKRGTIEPAAAEAGAGNKNSGSKKPTDYLENQRRISYQAATNTAVAQVDLFLKHEMIVFPKAAKPKDKMEAVQAIIEDLAESLYITYQVLPERHDELLLVEADSNPDAAVGDDESENDNEW